MSMLVTWCTTTTTITTTTTTATITAVLCSCVEWSGVAVLCCAGSCMVSVNVFLFSLSVFGM